RPRGIGTLRRGDMALEDRKTPPRRGSTSRGPTSAIEGSTQALAPAARWRNRRLQQDKISARLARVEPDDRTTLCGECETLRLAIQIAEPPRIKERSGAAT